MRSQAKGKGKGNLYLVALNPTEKPCVARFYVQGEEREKERGEDGE